MIAVEEEWLSKTVSLRDGIQCEIIDRIYHDDKAFLEGLCFHEGCLHKSTGLSGHSDVRQIDPKTGDTCACITTMKW